MKHNTSKTLRILIATFLILISIASVSALSLVGRFDNMKTTKEIIPGQSVSFYAMATADQNLSEMKVSARLYDITTNETVDLGRIFSETTTQTFFHPPEFTITAEDYQNLPGSYIIEIFAEETLTYGYYTSQIVELELEVLGNRPPVANYIYYPNNITTATQVTFESRSYDPDGFLVRQEWFANGVKIGEGSTLKHTFRTAGTYNVTIRVTDNDGATDEFSRMIPVAAGPITGYPIANFTNTDELCEDTTIGFISTSRDIDGTIELEEWDLNGDGTFESRGRTVSRLFQNEGTFTVTLRVTDDRGLQSSISRSFTIEECGEEPTEVPVANFTYTPTDACEGEEINFRSNSYDNDGWIVRTQWDFNNDGNADRTGSSTQWSFANAGIYPVTLRVTDNQGVTGSTTRMIVIEECEAENIPPIANFTYEPSRNITTATRVSFFSTSYDVDGEIVYETWYVDGVFAMSGDEMSFVFPAPGRYEVRLVVVDDDGASDSETKYITVTQAEIPNQAPTAEFDYDAEVCILEPAVFTSTSTDPDGEIVLERWYINDVFVGTGDVMTTIFAREGEYEVTLVVYDDDGATDTDTHTVTAVDCRVDENIPPVANFTWEPEMPQINELVIFTSTSYDPDGEIVDYDWFVDGDQTQDDDETMSLIFATPGVYEITLTVTDDDGATDSETKLIVVEEPDCSPNAVLRTPESVLVGENVEMDGLLSTADCNQTIVAYQWEVICESAGTYYTEITDVPFFNYTFTRPGECRVILIVYTDAGLSDSDEKRVFAGRPARGIQDGDEDGLLVEYFDVVGSDYGEIEMCEPFTVSATITNDRNEELKNLHVTFVIPEVGYKVEGERFSLGSGRTRTFSLSTYLDCADFNLMPGEYVALVGVSNSDIVRQKYMPIMVR